MTALLSDTKQRSARLFVDQAYDAVPQDDLLLQLARGFARVFAAMHSAIYVNALDRPSRIGVITFQAAIEQGDAVGAAAVAAKDSVLRFLEELVDDEQAVSTRLVTPPKTHSKAVYALALIIPLSGERKVALVGLRAQPFTFEEEQIASGLKEHLQRAIMLHIRFLAEGSRVLGTQLFEDSAIAMILTSRGLIERINGRAKHLLERSVPIVVRGGHLCFDDPRAQLQFDALSGGPAIDHTRGDDGTFAGLVGGPYGESWLLQLTRLQPKQGSPFDDCSQSSVLVALTQLDTASTSRRHGIVGFADLTAIEREILFAIVDGCDVATISRKMQRSSETIRWHVKRMFAKLGVDSQADLARLGSLLLPLAP